MQVTFLGTGSAMPTGDRMQTGLLASEADRHLLVDCGSGVLHRLAATDAGYEGVDAVLLTHHHLDHLSDLLPLLKARWLAGSDPIEVVGPAGTERLLADLIDAHDYLGGKLEYYVREIGDGVDPDGFSVAGFDVRAIETRHSVTCYAYRFDGGFAFSGDTEAFDGLADFTDGVEALAHDCSFPDDVDVSNHPTPDELGRVLAGHEYGRVYLTHLYPHTEGRHEEMLGSLGSHYDGEVRFARDGLAIEV